VIGIAGIMLANNICDIQEDRLNRRVTLPIWIGRNASLSLFVGLYTLSIVHDLLGLGLGWMPWYAGIVLLFAYVAISRWVFRFVKDPHKGRTFGNAVKAYLVLAIAHIVVLGLELVP
jgi:1,4-dihydroxy-2-naphthoate octaprenyltransferase